MSAWGEERTDLSGGQRTDLPGEQRTDVSGGQRTDLSGEEHTGLPGQPLWLAEDSFDQGRTDRRGWQLRERDPAYGGGDEGHSTHFGGWGLLLIVAATVVAVAVGLLRWWESSSVGVSSALLWGATALVAILLLWGIGLCLAGIFGGEGSEGRARFGAVLGLALSGAIVIYALTGGYDTIIFAVGDRDSAAWNAGQSEGGTGAVAEAEAPESVPGTEGQVIEDYEYRSLELTRHVFRDYRFRVDMPGAPYELKGEDLGGWDFGVRTLVDVPGVIDDAVFEVFATRAPWVTGGKEQVHGYLADVESRFQDEDELISATPGRLGAYPCAIQRSRYTGAESPEPILTTAFWVPGDGYEYLVRCVNFEDDWPRARAPMMDIVGTFRCW